MTDNTFHVITISFSIFALIVSLFVFLRQQSFQFTQQTQKIFDRIYELDKMIIQNPELQENVFNLRKTKSYFYDSTTPRGKEYFKLKTFVYIHLNFFDEFISTTVNSKQLHEVTESRDWTGYMLEKIKYPLLGRNHVIEITNWYKYITEKMKHPLFREVFFEGARNIWLCLSEILRRKLDRNL